MDLQDRQRICRKVIELTDKVAAFIREERLHFTADKIEYKGHQNLVSYVDKTAEKLLVDDLSNIKKADIIAEENKYESTGSEYTWIIDPLDGTTNFIHGLPPYCISVALNCQNETIIGVIREITTNDVYYSWGEGAFYNNNRIHVSDVRNIEDSLGATGIAYNITPENQAHFTTLFTYFNKEAHGARRTGSAAMNLAYVARGVVDFFYQVNLSAWDVAAGAYLIKEAGGVVTDFNQGSDYLFGKQIIATNKHLYKHIFDKVTE